MDLLNKLERRFGRWAIPNLTLWLCCLQVIGFALAVTKPEHLELMTLTMAQVAEGQVWRLGTFFLNPATANPLCFLLGIWFFYLTGKTLEVNWGDFRYSIYIAVGTLATFAVAAIYPQAQVSNLYIGTSVFLAFAHLYPDFVISLYYVLPIRIKWIAVLTWISYALVITFGPWPARLMVLASVSNFLLFFGKDILRNAADHKRHIEWHAKRLRRPDKPFHCCTICGATERTHPKMDFRYCTKCAGSYEYCADHLRTHEHVALGEAPAPQTATSEPVDSVARETG
ncbi:MAG TPA: hypothetical protein VJ783_26360 [Pirellulales bacterium]|nr:hypothetical protein [Pirellulales bacterium]